MSPIITTKPSATHPSSTVTGTSNSLVRMNRDLAPLFVSVAVQKMNSNDKIVLTGVIPLVKSVGYPYSLLLCVFLRTFWNSGARPAAADTKALAMSRHCWSILTATRVIQPSFWQSQFTIVTWKSQVFWYAPEQSAGRILVAVFLFTSYLGAGAKSRGRILTVLYTERGVQELMNKNVEKMKIKAMYIAAATGRVLVTHCIYDHQTSTQSQTSAKVIDALSLGKHNHKEYVLK